MHVTKQRVCNSTLLLCSSALSSSCWRETECWWLDCEQEELTGTGCYEKIMGMDKLFIMWGMFDGYNWIQRFLHDGLGMVKF